MLQFHSEVLCVSLALSLVVATSNGQIAFGGSKDYDDYDPGEPQQASFTFQDASSSSGGLDLSDIIGEPDIATRLGPSTKMQGNSCQTPRNRAGVCSFISESQCSPVVRRIRRDRRRNGGRVSQSLIQFIRDSIRSPCGFDRNRNDWTLCCRSRNTGGGGGNNNGGGGNNGGGNNNGGGGNNGGGNNGGGNNGGGNNGGGGSSQTNCGISPSGTRIVGGVESSVGAWPWATILGSARGSSFRVVCGGTLISPNHVLTAAHCFPGGSNSGITTARLGEHDINTAREGANHRDITIASVKVHESYSTNSLKNDIAIVTLRNPVQLGGNIRQACLPNTFRGVDLTRRPNPFVIGWGSTRTGGGTVSTIRQVCTDK